MLGARFWITSVAVCFCVVLGSLGTPSLAAAQWGSSRLNRPTGDGDLVHDLELSFWGDAGFYAGSSGDRDVGFGVAVGADLLSFTPTFGAMARFLEYVGVEFVVPLAFAHQDPWGMGDLQSAFQGGNPWLAAHFVYDVGEDSDDFHMLVRVGFGWAFPGAHIDTSGARAGEAGLALLGGYYTRGGWNGLLFLEDHFGLGIPAGLEVWFGGIGYVASEAGFFWGFNQNDGTPDDPGDTGFFQLAVEGGIEPIDSVRISLRLQGVAEIEDPVDNDDDFQLAAEPRVTFASGAFFGSLGMLINLDQPAGVLGNDFEDTTPGVEDFIPGIWCLRVAAGARL